MLIVPRTALALATSVCFFACHHESATPTVPAAVLDGESAAPQDEPQAIASGAPEDVAGAPSDAHVSPTGLAYKVLRPGTGSQRPTATSRVRVHYIGWTTDGKQFDSSYSRGQPATFPLNGVIAGWTEGLQTMVEGEKTRLWIPEDLAYRGQAGRPQGMLVFDVELLKIVER